MKWQRLGYVLFGVISFVLLSIRTSQSFAQVSPTYHLAFSGGNVGAEDIFIIETNGGTLLNLTNSPHSERNPDWSQDGNRLVFVSDQSGNDDIYLVDSNGANLSPLTATPEIQEREPAWSPESDKIAYVGRDETGDSIYLVDLNDNDAQVIFSQSSPINGLEWAADSGAIYFWQLINDQGQIFRLDLETSQATQVTSSGNYSSVNVSPTEPLLLTQNTTTNGIQIELLDALTGQMLRSLTAQGVNSIHPTWSSDGTQVGFSSDLSGSFHIYTMNSDGTATTQISRLGARNLYPTWQPVPTVIDVENGNAVLLQSSSSPVTPSPDITANNEVLGEGMLNVFYPDTINPDDPPFVLRVEILGENLVNTGLLPTFLTNVEPEELQESGEISIYRFMGARLEGLDLVHFDTFPSDTSQMIVIDSDGVNYWEWEMQLKETSQLGSYRFGVVVYAPEQLEEGVPTERTLAVTRVQVAIDAEASGSGATTINVVPLLEQVYIDSNTLIIKVLDDRDLGLIELSTSLSAARLNWLLSDSSVNDNLPLGTCLRFYRYPNLPSSNASCESDYLDVPLSTVDVFWSVQDSQPRVITYRNIDTVSLGSCLPDALPCTIYRD